MSVSVLAQNHVEIHVLIGLGQLPSDATVITASECVCVVSVFTQSFNMRSFLAAKPERKSVYSMLLETIIMCGLSSLCTLQRVLRSVSVCPQDDK